MSDSNVYTGPKDQSNHAYSPKLLIAGDTLRHVQEAPKGTAYTYGATPLDQIATMTQQEELRINLKALTYKVEDGIPMEIVSYVHDTFSRRFDGRRDANDENFVNRLVFDYESRLDPTLVEMIDKGRMGEASPAELMLIRDILGIRSVELACLTHPYGERIELLGEMRSAVQYAVELFDGDYYDEPETRYRIKEVVGEDDDSLLIDGSAPGLLMTRKRTLGQLPDGTMIRERSSFVLRIDEGSELYALLGQQEVEELKSMVNLTGQEQEEILKKYKRIIENMLETDQFTEAIPVSTTIYAYNYETARLVEETADIRKAEREKIFQANNPEANPFILSDDELEEEMRIQAQIEAERDFMARQYLEEAKHSAIYFTGEYSDDDVETETSSE